ncbi:MAG: undecaprenyldiphospho-muramoylpentapeptide beta-N-acetylglucosaminyltransferase [Vicinamibacteraceae bacterium]
MSDTSLRVVIAGGGTGGHLFPGLAIAREILARRPDAVVTFAGTARGIEARAVPAAGFALDTIRSLGLKGKSPVALARGVATLPLSAVDAMGVIARRRPHVVVGVGGYSSGPIAVAAWLRRVPVLLHEQNAQAGLTNRLVARLARAIALTYDQTSAGFGEKSFVSGNPVRPQFLHVGPEPAGARRVLIFGGSQGAHAINLAVVEAASQLARATPPPHVTHQTGERDLAEVREGLARAGLAARVEPFLDRMDEEMSAASVIVCRAGSTTLAEIAAVGRAAILVPLPTATDDHQRKNAAALSSVGAAELLEQRELTGATLATRILALLDDEPRRAQLAAAVKRFARPDAARVIVDRVLEIAQPSVAKGVPAGA